jgi:hypothetical protein
VCAVNEDFNEVLKSGEKRCDDQVEVQVGSMAAFVTCQVGSRQPHAHGHFRRIQLGQRTCFPHIAV